MNIATPNRRFSSLPSRHHSRRYFCSTALGVISSSVIPPGNQEILIVLYTVLVLVRHRQVGLVGQYADTIVADVLRIYGSSSAATPHASACPM